MVSLLLVGGGRGSKPAFELTVVCMPAEVLSTAPAAAAAQTETQERYRTFFQALIDELRTVHKFTNARAGQPQNWYTFASENSKFYKFSAVFAQGDRVRVETYIDCGDKLRNEAIFDYLVARKLEVENAFGQPLAWERLNNRRACRIAIYRDGSVDAESELLADIQKWCVANLLKMRQTFPPFFAQAINATPAASP